METGETEVACSQLPRADIDRERTSLFDKFPFLARPGTWRVQMNIMPVAAGNRTTLRSRLPRLPTADLLPLFSAAIPVNLAAYDTAASSEDAESSQTLDDETFALLQSLQLRGASGLALELVTPQLDGIRDPHLRLKFASIVFDMMHVRGRYEDAAELIEQELALHPETSHLHSPLLLPLKVRLVHHKMFYRPVTELWPKTS